MPTFSDGFQRLYCDPAVFDPFSAWHPINIRRVLPIQPQDSIIDDERLISAELAHLDDENDDTRRAVIDAYALCGLMSQEDAANVKSVIDFYGKDFFDLMGLVYANAGMFICALRWYRECLALMETQNTQARSDEAGVYANVGYCLYALGMFEEAIAWTKSCIGPRLITDVACRALIEYEAQQADGRLFAIERTIDRARYTISARDPGDIESISSRLRTATRTVAPFQESYFDWVSDTMRPLPAQDGYPFFLERDCSIFPRHKMNLLFALCGQADALITKGFIAEAKRLLFEASILEPNAGFIKERIKAL
jgi:tetratricopeptide (TPR) repeat protein